MPARITIHHVSKATQELLVALEREPKAVQSQACAIIEAIASVREACRTPVPRLAYSLAQLASKLLVDVPYRLTQQAMHVLLVACDRCCSSVEQYADLIHHAAPLWAGGIGHPNREVRASTLALLARLLTASPLELPAAAIDSVLDCGVTTPLAALLCEKSRDGSSGQVLSAVLALRGLLRSSRAVDRSREEGLLAAQLRGMPSSVRQGALGIVTRVRGLLVGTLTQRRRRMQRCHTVLALKLLLG